MTRFMRCFGYLVAVGGWFAWLEGGGASVSSPHEQVAQLIKLYLCMSFSLSLIKLQLFDWWNLTD